MWYREEKERQRERGRQRGREKEKRSEEAREGRSIKRIDLGGKSALAMLAHDRATWNMSDVRIDFVERAPRCPSRLLPDPAVPLTRTITSLSLLLRNPPPLSYIRKREWTNERKRTIIRGSSLWFFLLHSLRENCPIRKCSSWLWENSGSKRKNLSERGQGRVKIEGRKKMESNTKE